MKGASLRFSLAATALALAGCAALDVSVDVYKGALIDPHRIRTEQLGAMAMGAKPLLLQLRYEFETDCRKLRSKVRQPTFGFNEADFDRERKRHGCDLDYRPKVERPGARCLEDLGPDVEEKEECLTSWKARRVNAILALYGPRAHSRADEMMYVASEKLESGYAAARRLIVAVATDFGPKGANSADLADLSNEKLTEAYSIALLARIRQVHESLLKKTSDAGPAAENVRLASVLSSISAGAAGGPVARFTGDEVHEAERLLVEGLGSASKERLREMRRDLLGAWKYASGLLADSPYRKAARPAHLMALAEMVATITNYYLLADQLKSLDAGQAALFPKLLAENAALNRTEREHRISQLSEALAGIDGARVAGQLLRMNESLMKSGPITDAYHKQLVTTPGIVPFLGTVNRIRASLRTFLTPFGGGRRADGVERLVEDYVAAQDEIERTGRDQRFNEMYREVRGKRWRLIYALIDFAQKIVSMANYEALLPGDVETEALSKSVRLLQAIGNSILSQIAEYKYWDEYDSRQISGVSTQLGALQAAADSVRTEAIGEIRLEVVAGKDALLEPDKKVLLAGLEKGAAAFKDVRQILDKQRAAVARSIAETGKEVAAEIRANELAGRAAFANALEPAFHRSTIEARRARLRDAAGRWIRSVAGESGMDSNEGKAGIEKLKGHLDAVIKAAAVADTSVTIILATGKRIDESTKKLEAAKRKAQAYEQQVIGWDLRYSAVADPVAGGLGNPTPPTGGRFQDSKRVLDALVTGLQNLYVLETKGGLAERAKRTKQAIEAANAFRTGMVFIRPAAVFLRDSYPATILQDDPSGRQDLLRLKLPSREPLTQAQQAQQTIDKQFWQTVNHISLTGAGNTNYVLTKDDIGNWYVKGYSSDPTQIYQSASNLLLFATAARHQAEALVSREIGVDPAKTGTGGSASPYNRNLLKRQFTAASDKYDGDLRKALEGARKAARDMKEDLLAAAMEDVSKTGVVEKIVTEPNEKTEKAISDLKGKSDKDLEANGDAKRDDNFTEAMKLLDAMRAYRTRVLAALARLSSDTEVADKLKKDADKTKDEAGKVKAALEKKSASIINGVMGPLENALSRFEQKLRFSLETASEKAKADSKPEAKQEAKTQ